MGQGPRAADGMVALRRLLDEFASVPERPPTKQTYMEIARYPHLENVCSNILAHFFDPRSGHGLGTAVLESLLSVIGTPVDQLSNIEVSREMPTDAGGRIDIVVSTDQLILGIEHKIYATLSNDLDDYYALLQSLAAEKCLHAVLLTLQPVVSVNSRFRAISYGEWIPVLLRHVGSASVAADLQQLSILLDFIRTIQHLAGAPTMNADLIEFVKQRLGDVTEFLTRIDELQRELRAKVSQVEGQLETPPRVTRGLWRDRTTLTDVLFHDVLWPGDQRLAIDAIITPAGWQVVAFRRRGTSLDISAVLEEAGYSYEPWPTNPSRWLLSDLQFKYTQDLLLADALRALLARLVSVRDQGSLMTQPSSDFAISTIGEAAE